MTMVTTLFNSNKKEAKKIEFVKYVDLYSGAIDDEPSYDPKDFDNVKLIASRESFDLIAAWDDESDHSDVFVYLGHWNDGIA